MTTNPAITAPIITAPIITAPITTAPITTDPRPGFSRAATIGLATISGVRAEQLDDPTPCDAYDVRALCGHLVAVLRRIAAVARGEDPFSVEQVVEGVPAAGWADAYRAAQAEVTEAWDDPAVLDRPLTLPFATLPGAVALAIYTSEVLVHTWDLATATGQRPAWDDELAERALQTMRHALPADHRGGEIPFAAVVPVGDDAPAIDRLAAWVGRTPTR